MNHFLAVARKGLQIVVAIAVLLDAALLIEVHILEMRERTMLSPISRSKDLDRDKQPPAGYDSDGRSYVASPASSTGWAIRYASESCHFCKEDQPEWNKLALKLKRAGFNIRIILPTARSRYSESTLAPYAIPHENYVDVGWLERYRLIGTPTVIIFNQTIGESWIHQGTMSDDDEKTAERIAGVD